MGLLSCNIQANAPLQHINVGGCSPSILSYVASHGTVFEDSSSGCLTQCSASLHLLSAFWLTFLVRCHIPLCPFKLTFRAMRNMRSYASPNGLSIRVSTNLENLENLEYSGILCWELGGHPVPSLRYYPGISSV